MWPNLFSVNSKRKRLFEKTSPGALQEYYAVPFPEKGDVIKDVAFAVLDFETTGLEIKRDHLVSIGLVKIINLGINLDTVWHQIIKTSHAMTEETTVIHEITDDMVEQGLDIKEAFDALLDKLKGHVLIAHHADIELGFLQKICRTIYQQEFFIPVIDTQVLAERQLSRSREILKNGSLRLFNLRERYGLPAYKAHNALNDALATAELFLAVVSDLYPKLNCKLKDIITGK